MKFKKGQLVMKVKHPQWPSHIGLKHSGYGPLVPIRSVGEVLEPQTWAYCGCPGIKCHWPVLNRNYIMQSGTIIPLNDPDYKEDNEQCGEKINTTEELPKVKITEGQS